MQVAQDLNIWMWWFLCYRYTKEEGQGEVGQFVSSDSDVYQDRSLCACYIERHQPCGILLLKCLTCAACFAQLCKDLLTCQIISHNSATQRRHWFGMTMLVACSIYDKSTSQEAQHRFPPVSGCIIVIKKTKQVMHRYSGRRRLGYGIVCNAHMLGQQGKVIASHQKGRCQKSVAQSCCRLADGRLSPYRLC